jgi:hypothetical protein
MSGRLAAAFVLSLLSGCVFKKTVPAPAPSPMSERPKPPRVQPEAAPSAAKRPPAPEKRGEARRIWLPTGAFRQRRFQGEMRKLADGRVLLIGGMVGTARGLTDVDLYDPATGRWSSGAPLRQGRYEFAAATLADGRVLVSGGIGPDGAVVDTVELYDPRADSWTEAAPMAQVRQGHQLLALPDGRVLAAGGYDGRVKLSSSEFYDPVRDSWSGAGEMGAGRFFATMTLLKNGKVLISGGSGFASCDLFDPATGRWRPTGSMSLPRYYHRDALLPDGRVLVTGGGAGGDVGAVRETAEIYDPTTEIWTMTPPLGIQRYGHAMVMAAGTPLLIGGENHSTALDSTEIYDAVSGSWRPGPRLEGPRAYPHAVALDDGRVLAAGGRRGLINGLPLATAEVLSAAGAFAPSGAPFVPRVPAERAYARAPAPPPADAADDESPESPESLPAPAPARPRAHALVIGVERYRQNLPRADFAASDARLTAEYFRRVLGVPEENLAFLGDDLATKGDFEKYFERWLPNRVEKGDEVFVYFSGHGAPDAKSGEAYLVPFDADPTYIEQTGYSIKRMYAQLAKLPAERVVVVLDSCFSGAGGRSVLAEGARPLVSVVQSGVPRGLVVMTASAGDQISNSYREKRHGLFTYFFLKGLKEKRDDLRAAFDYLKPQVSRVARRRFNSDQEPQWRAGR